MILNMSNGGNGAALNFKVVGGTSTPSNPTENTIWVNTSTAVTGWDFSATEPPRRSNNKNLVVYPYSEGTKTTNGITYTVNSDGSITASGTPSATAWFTVCNTSNLIWLEPGTYKFSGCPNGGGASKVKMALRPQDGGSDITDGGTGGVTFTLTKYTAFQLLIAIYTAAGKVSNIVFKPQLEVGSTATSFVKGDATGHVWIYVGNSSPVEFNALKANGINAYPLTVSQYENGAWVDKTAKSYQYGAWVDWWDGMLFDISNPTKYEGITGGWTSEAKYMNSGNGTPTQINPELYDTYLRFWIGDSWYGYGMVWLVNKINLTNYNQIVANATIGTNSAAPARLAVWSSIREYISSNIVAEVEVQSGSPTTLSVSSLSGEYYVGFYLGCGEYGYKYIDLTKLYCT